MTKKIDELFKYAAGLAARIQEQPGVARADVVKFEGGRKKERPEIRLLGQRGTCAAYRAALPEGTATLYVKLQRAGDFSIVHSQIMRKYGNTDADEPAQGIGADISCLFEETAKLAGMEVIDATRQPLTIRNLPLRHDLSGYQHIAARHANGTQPALGVLIVGGMCEIKGMDLEGKVHAPIVGKLASVLQRLGLEVEVNAAYAQPHAVQ